MAGMLLLQELLVYRHRTPNDLYLLYYRLFQLDEMHLLGTIILTVVTGIQHYMSARRESNSPSSYGQYNLLVEACADVRGGGGVVVRNRNQQATMATCSPILE